MSDIVERIMDMMPTVEKTHTIIPAQPGWFVAMYIPGCKADHPRDSWDHHLRLTPIVAWDIAEWVHQIVLRDVTPITIGVNVHTMRPPWAIKMPDEQYVYGGTQYGDDLAGLLAAMKSEHEEISARRARDHDEAGKMQ
jgi:hypothetical protein